MIISTGGTSGQANCPYRKRLAAWSWWTLLALSPAYGETPPLPDSAAHPAAEISKHISTREEPRALIVGSDLYPVIALPTDQSRFDRSSNLLVNTLGAKTGLFGAAAREGLTWANRYMPGTDQSAMVQLYALSTSGNYGAFFGARSSDNPSTRPENVIGSVSLVVADGDRPHYHWARYAEGYVPRGKTSFRLLINDENSIQNEANGAPPADPYDFNPDHLLNNLRLDCGIGMGDAHSCTNPLSILNNGAAYRLGILFGDKSIELTDGAANAIALPAHYALSWFGAPGRPAWRIYSTAHIANAGKILMEDDSVSFQVGSANDAPTLRIGQGEIATPAVIASGQPPSMSGNCPVRDQRGGNTAGAFVLARDCAAGMIIVRFAATAPTGWSCFASDLTSARGNLRESAYDRTSVTLAAASLQRSDSIVFSCTAF